jgi:predicted transcriptional regulator
MQINTSKIEQETLAILQDTELMRDIESGKADIAAGNFISHEEMKKKLKVS